MDVDCQLVLTLPGGMVFKKRSVQSAVPQSGWDMFLLLPVCEGSEIRHEEVHCHVIKVTPREQAGETWLYEVGLNLMKAAHFFEAEALIAGLRSAPSKWFAQ